MSDPLDDLLNTPSGPFSPMDPMEFNAPGTMVESLIRIAVAQFTLRRVQFVSEHPLDAVGQEYHAQRIQSAINALAWVERQRTELIKIGLYPIDPASELEMYEELQALDPTLFDPQPGDLPGLTDDYTDIQRHIDRIQRERPADDTEEPPA